MSKIALTRDWRDDDDNQPFDLSMFVGAITSVEYSDGRQRLLFRYADGRAVSITLAQCSTHRCDDTCMVVNSGPSSEV